jgi:hypothetical protein
MEAGREYEERLNLTNQVGSWGTTQTSSGLEMVDRESRGRV